MPFNCIYNVHKCIESLEIYSDFFRTIS